MMDINVISDVQNYEQIEISENDRTLWMNGDSYILVVEESDMGNPYYDYYLSDSDGNANRWIGSYLSIVFEDEEGDVKLYEYI